MALYKGTWDPKPKVTHIKSTNLKSLKCYTLYLASAFTILNQELPFDCATPLVEYAAVGIVAVQMPAAHNTGRRLLFYTPPPEHGTQSCTVFSGVFALGLSAESYRRACPDPPM